MKVIAFDLIGVLARETNFVLSPQEDKLERYFGRDISNDEFEIAFQTIFRDKTNMDNIIDHIVNNLYVPKNIDVLEYLNNHRNQYKVIIATNHVKNIENFINKYYKNFVDGIFISSNIGVNKPHKEFYQYLLDFYHIKPNNMIFIDDSQTNIEGASNLGINTIKCSNDINLLNELKKVLKK